MEEKEEPPEFYPVKLGIIPSATVLAELHRKVIQTKTNNQIVLQPYYEALKVYENKWGTIARTHICSSLPWAAFLTEYGYLDIQYEAQEGGPLESIIVNCRSASDRVWSLLKTEDRESKDAYNCNVKYFFVLEYIFNYFKGIHPNDGLEKLKDELKEQKVLQVASSMYKDAEVKFMQVAQRRAKILYFRGMIKWGGPIWLLLSVLSFLVIYIFEKQIADARYLWWPTSLLAGGFGALVSVMTRMKGKSLLLDIDTSKRMLTLFGATRILVGAVIGTAICVLVKGGLLPIQVSKSPEFEIFSYMGIAFLAGFGERWAQDMLNVAKNTISPVK
jgi:hypothetical protein